jgi:hypothetical protein
MRIRGMVLWNDTAMPTSVAVERRRPVWLAIVEVVLAFSLVHVAYRSFKHFTELGRLEGEAGLNFSPGTAMILFTVATLLVCRRDFAAYGLTLKRWR